ncbi:MAG: hypothetical protein WD772_06710 [Pseudohongiellaceae bacterium]
MKPSVFLVTVLLLASFSSSVFADSRHYRRDRGFNDHYRYDRNYYRPDRNHYRSYAGNRNYFSISYGRNYRRQDHFNSGSFVGGLLLGSTLGRYSAPRHETVYSSVRINPPSRNVTVIRQESGVVSQAPSRRLLKDLQGRCFERVQENGQEILLELDVSECDY